MDREDFWINEIVNPIGEEFFNFMKKISKYLVKKVPKLKNHKLIHMFINYSWDEYPVDFDKAMIEMNNIIMSLR